MDLNKDTPLDQHFFAPLYQAFEARDIWNCREYSDWNHLISSVSRVIENVESGRDWIQQLGSLFGRPAKVGELFDALKSERRTQMVISLAKDLAGAMKEQTPTGLDPLSAYAELDGFEVFASDGHTLAASAHEEAIIGKIRPHTHIFCLSLRSHSMQHLDLCTPEIGKKKEQEISTLQRTQGSDLRMGTPRGTKVIHCYDPAVIGYQWWYTWKQGSGVYIITVEKSNSALQSIKNLDFDDEAPENFGVQSDESLLSSEGVALRRVTYIDPVTNRQYRFLTNEMTLPPGIIAFLYKLRWDIEKVFDQSKNKFHEKKAWARSKNSKKQQAHFITIAHNLCVLLERRLQIEEAIVDQKVIKKRNKRRKEEREVAEKNNRPFNALVGACNRITQRSLQFIRWLRASVKKKTPWSRAIEELRPLMLEYIS